MAVWTESIAKLSKVQGKGKTKQCKKELSGVEEKWQKSVENKGMD